jgi:GNAT superfamily N-acetyltransferase
MSRWIVRPLRMDEFSQWKGLWQGYQRFYETNIPDEVTELTWKRFHDSVEPMHVLGAFEGGSNPRPETGTRSEEAPDDEGRLLGIVHYIFHRSCWTAGPYCYLQDLFTAPEVRGRGVGRSLIEAVYASAAEAGASRVWWLTQESNVAGRRLYDTLADQPGFIQYRKTLT